MIRERARAKVNLTLRVLGRRPDGYHEIDSLIAFAEDAFDIVTLDIDKPVGVTASGPFATAIVGENIVSNALVRLAEVAPQLELGAVHIEKRLPVAAGLGGGSANAGALLRAVATSNPKSIGDVDWMAIATDLGADVPVCFVNVPCRVSGLGEQLDRLPLIPALNAVLINTLDAAPADKTAQVFKLLAAEPLSATSSQDATAIPASSRDLARKMSEIGNDLEPAARKAFPAIASVLDALNETEACQYAAMSGAGPTCYGLFDDADKAAAILASRHPEWWIKATVL